MIAQYSALSSMADTKPGRRLDTLLRLADLNRALDQLPLDLWRVVLVHGLIGIPREEAAAELQTSPRSVSRRYREAIEEVTYTMNGGIT